MAIRKRRKRRCMESATTWTGLPSHALQIKMLTVLQCSWKLNRKKVFGDDYSSVSVVLDIINVKRTKIPGSALNILTTELNVYWAKTAKSSPSPSPTRSPSNAELKRRKLYQLHNLKKSNKTKSNTMI